MTAGIVLGGATRRLRSSEDRRRLGLLAGGALVFVASFVLAAGYGAVGTAPAQIAAIVLKPVGIDPGWMFSPVQESVFWAIRLPRACLAVLSGAALAVSGAALQGLFRNPLADPALIGVSNGAALGGVAAIVFGASVTVSWFPPEYRLPIAAFAGGLAAVWLVNRLATRQGHTDVPTMLLAGVALNAMAGAGIGAFVFVSDDQQLRELNFWLLGSLGSITWDRLAPVALIAMPGIVCLFAFARFLDAMLLGESETMYLGFEVERTKKLIIVCAAVCTGATVSATGVIGFIGLVVPHVVRMIAGPGHKMLLPLSVLVGASLMLIADIVARTAVLPAELPIGIVTACVGGPFFIWLLMRQYGVGRWS